MDERLYDYTLAGQTPLGYKFDDGADAKANSFFEQESSPRIGYAVDEVLQVQLPFRRNQFFMPFDQQRDIGKNILPPEHQIQFKEFVDRETEVVNGSVIVGSMASIATQPRLEDVAPAKSVDHYGGLVNYRRDLYYGPQLQDATG